MAEGQINVLVWTQLCGADEAKQRSKAAGAVKKVGDVSLMGDSFEVPLTTPYIYR